MKYISVSVFLVLWCAGALTQHNCNSDKVSVIKFNIVSRRNESGHWNAKINFQHEAEKENSGPWEFDVDHVTTKYQSKDSVQIQLILTGPPSLEENVIRALRAQYELVLPFGYYKLHKVKANWQTALKTCMVEGSHLLIINYEEEANAVDSIISRNATTSEIYWIGMHDQFKEGNYITIFNQTLASTGYIKWRSRQPDNSTSENCGYYRYKEGFGDYSCSDSKYFICEREL